MNVKIFKLMHKVKLYKLKIQSIILLVLPPRSFHKITSSENPNRKDLSKVEIPRMDSKIKYQEFVRTVIVLNKVLGFVITFFSPSQRVQLKLTKVQDKNGSVFFRLY